jgi:hypothetical protein
VRVRGSDRPAARCPAFRDRPTRCPILSQLCVWGPLECSGRGGRDNGGDSQSSEDELLHGTVLSQLCLASLLTHVVLLNRSVQAWQREKQVGHEKAMPALVEVLDMLAQHFRDEIARDGIAA